MTLNQLVQTWENELDKASDNLIVENPIKYNQLRNYIVDIKKSMNEKKSNIVINKERHEVIIDGEAHVFPKKIFRMINYFSENPNRCITRDELLKNCWEEGVVVCNRTVDVHVCKIKRYTKKRMNIENQKGVGYRYKI